MSRKEAVLLVSRAISILQMIYALMELTYLPIRFASLIHHTARLNAVGPSGYDEFWSGYYRLDIAFLFARVAICMLLALLFWNCGPWIARILLPKCETHEQPE
ncbi:MAG: hypothetical protein WCA21_09930 [Terracidiphilus sp.]